MNEAKGAMIVRVPKDGPAATEDIKVGDVLTELDGSKIADSRDLARMVANLRPGTAVDLSVTRRGEKRKANVTLGAFPAGQPAPQPAPAAATPAKAPKGKAVRLLGMSVAPGKSADGETGLVVAEVDAASEAAKGGLKAGDVILQVGGEQVAKPDDAKRQIEEGRSPHILLYVGTGDSRRFVALKL